MMIASNQATVKVTHVCSANKTSPLQGYSLKAGTFTTLLLTHSLTLFSDILTGAADSETSPKIVWKQ